MSYAGDAISKTLYFEDVAVGDALEPLRKKPTNVDLFMYSAAVWLLHRIHYDHKFATEHEGLPDVVVGGTLGTDWIAQLLHEWAGRTLTLRKLSYQNRNFMVPDEGLECGGIVLRKYVAGGEGRVDCAVWIRKEDGTQALAGEATVCLEPRSESTFESYR